MQTTATREISNAPPFANVTDRARLVGLCFRMTGDPDAAEDLAQETLFEGWDHRGELRDPSCHAQWLAGIARNRCLHWLRGKGREAARRIQPIGYAGGEDLSLENLLADDVDLEIELERSELADLLDRAMASLPPDTRRVLLEKYVDELPQAEIARRLGVAEGAIEARLHRGKLALRRVLTTELVDDAVAYGLVKRSDSTGWQETRLWCSLCGNRRLLGRFTDGNRRMVLTCPACLPAPPSATAHQFNTVVDTGISDDLREVRGFRAGTRRLFDWMLDMLPRRDGDPVRCAGCRRPIATTVAPLNDLPVMFSGRLAVSIACPRCALNATSLIAGFALALPESRRFWREHPRIRLLPERAVEVNGQPSLIVRFGAVDSLATLDAVVALDTLRFRIIAAG